VSGHDVWWWAKWIFAQVPIGFAAYWIYRVLGVIK
jgi:hypothetical protein